MGLGGQTAGGLMVKSHSISFLFVMVPSKGQVDHDVWLQYVVCLCCASLCPFNHLILFLEQYSRSTHPPSTRSAASIQRHGACTTAGELPLQDRLRGEMHLILSINGFNVIIEAKKYPKRRGNRRLTQILFRKILDKACLLHFLKLVWCMRPVSKLW